MNPVREFLRPFEQAGGFFHVAGGILVGAELDHFMDKLGVEEALFAGLGLGGPDFEGINHLLVGDFVVERCRKGGERECAGKNEHKRGNRNTHDEPPHRRVFD